MSHSRTPIWRSAVSTENQAAGLHQVELFGVTLGAFYTNCWILCCDTNCIVIDPGLEPDELLGLLEERALRPTRVLLTHGHLDHVAGCRELDRRYGMPIFLHPADAFLYHGAAEMARIWNLNVENPPERTVDLTDGQRLPFGGRELEVISTPGHSPGSISLRFQAAPDDVLLFSGDTLFAGSIGRTDLPGGDAKALGHSILERLFKLPGDALVLPGHNETTTLAAERKDNPVRAWLDLH